MPFPASLCCPTNLTSSSTSATAQCYPSYPQSSITICACNAYLGFTTPLHNEDVPSSTSCSRSYSTPENDFCIVTAVLLLIAYLILFFIAAVDLWRRLSTNAFGDTVCIRFDDANSFSLILYVCGTILGVTRNGLWLAMAVNPDIAQQYNISAAYMCAYLILCFFTGGLLFVCLVWMEMARSIDLLDPNANASARPRRKWAVGLMIAWLIVLILCFCLNDSVQITVAAYSSIPFFLIIIVAFLYGSFKLTRLLVDRDTPMFQTYLTTPKPQVEMGFYLVRRTTFAVGLSMVIFFIVVCFFFSTNSNEHVMNAGDINPTRVTEAIMEVCTTVGCAFVVAFLHTKLRKSIVLRKRAISRQSSSKEESVALPGGGGGGARALHTRSLEESPHPNTFSLRGTSGDGINIQKYAAPPAILRTNTFDDEGSKGSSRSHRGSKDTEDEIISTMAAVGSPSITSSSPPPPQYRHTTSTMRQAVNASVRRDGNSSGGGGGDGAGAGAAAETEGSKGTEEDEHVPRIPSEDGESEGSKISKEEITTATVNKTPPKKVTMLDNVDSLALI